MGLARRCAECPAEVADVCRHAFGRWWEGKSTCGQGCDHPMDGVAEAWYARGWRPETRQPRENDLRSVSLAGGVITLACPTDAPTGVSDAAGGVSVRMPRRPARPKVSEAILRGADLFFGRGL